MDNRVRKYMKIGIAAVVLVLMIPFLIQLLTESLWFKELGYVNVFSKRIIYQVLFFIGGGVLTFFLSFVNIKLALKGLSRIVIKRTTLIVSGILAFFYGLSVKELWMTFLQFANRTPFNITDPLFSKDISFYVFGLPLAQAIYSMVLSLLIVIIVITAVIYIFKPYFRGTNESVGYENIKDFMKNGAQKSVFFDSIIKGKAHLAVLISAVILILAAGYILKSFNLLYSPSGIVYGAGYTDYKAILPSYYIMMAALIASVIMFNVFLKKNKVRHIVVTAIALIAISIVSGGIYPLIVEKIYVEPNQLEAEERYIGYNLEFTRKAYGLDNVIERAFDYEESLDAKTITNDLRTVENIRLWDWQPLLSTYSQLQEIRLYYKFHDVDVDRYIINGKEKQVMLSAREMDINSLPSDAKNWINEHLKYTHGYGMVVSPVNEIGIDGLPTFMVNDIPPKGIDELYIDRPQIYFGEKTNDYVLVGTKTDEFDYPVGDTNAYFRYDGAAGVKLSNFFIKVAYAVKFGTMKLLLSSDVTKDTSIVYNRNIVDRAKKIAPFLSYDNDPYPVITNGKIIWIIDAYTSSKMYPYSQPLTPKNGVAFNYIRNSVKVTIDAYTGETIFYTVDENDPLIKAYSSAFPGLFASIDTMPIDIKEHLRYPEDMFNIQTSVYATYHMKEPAIFYNKEDYWMIPNEIYGDQKTVLAPYYVNMSLPGEDEFGFVTILPYTPASKDNMVAWMAAKCDWSEYGKLVVYKFSKQRTIYGPMQVEAQIDQDSEISKLLSLWNQKGSNVIRGNMMVYPIGNSFLFVEPLFLAAERSQIPQLKLVIVSDGTRVSMGENLNEALTNLVGYKAPNASILPKDVSSEPSNLDNDLVNKAYALILEAKNKMTEGDWAGYGEVQKQLEETLKELVER